MTIVPFIPLPALAWALQKSRFASFVALAYRPVVAYAGGAVRQPLINVEEKIDKIVGRRTRTPDALSVETSRKDDAMAWRRAFGGVRVPRGVHRFHTHEEADEWLWRMIARPPPS